MGPRSPASRTAVPWPGIGALGSVPWSPVPFPAELRLHRSPTHAQTLRAVLVPLAAPEPWHKARQTVGPFLTTHSRTRGLSNSPLPSCVSWKTIGSQSTAPALKLEGCEPRLLSTEFHPSRCDTLPQLFKPKCSYRAKQRPQAPSGRLLAASATHWD